MSFFEVMLNRDLLQYINEFNPGTPLKKIKSKDGFIKSNNRHVLDHSKCEYTLSSLLLAIEYGNVDVYETIMICYGFYDFKISSRVINALKHDQLSIIKYIFEKHYDDDGEEHKETVRIFCDQDVMDTACEYDRFDMFEYLTENGAKFYGTIVNHVKSVKMLEYILPKLEEFEKIDEIENEDNFNYFVCNTYYTTEYKYDDRSYKPQYNEKCVTNAIKNKNPELAMKFLTEIRDESEFHNNHYCYDALYHASENGYLELVEILAREYKYRCNSFEYHEQTSIDALKVAVQNNHEDVMNCLLYYGGMSRCIHYVFRDERNITMEEVAHYFYDYY